MLPLNVTLKDGTEAVIKRAEKVSVVVVVVVCFLLDRPHEL